MASRRVRIKGVASLPQRKKPLSLPDSEQQPEKEETESTCAVTAIDTPNLNVNATSGSKDGALQERQEPNPSGDTTTDLVVQDTPLSNDGEHDIAKQSVSTEKKANKVPFSRRKFLKPVVCVNALNRTCNVVGEEAKVSSNNLKPEQNTSTNLNEIEISASNTNIPLSIHKKDLTEDPLSFDADIPKQVEKDTGKFGSDTEYPQPPPSPTKILNRRIKAIPKLHQRRTSFSIGSASESEDDTRRSYNRIRNDSVCSTNSGINENAISEAKSPSRREPTIVKRKCRRSDQTRKLAEARREFNMKFNNCKPDKQKLTMIDLIFYNPSTSPMSSNQRKRKSTTSSEIIELKTNQDEEKVDDPQLMSESENEVPAPQIKVGPNGEIIIDEKSLIIENVETKRSREALQKSEIVNGDDDTTYGVYKRVKRTKEWSKEETLRFYRALNTIGTDFTLMSELFPNRTRREIKMKFKKEERLNQSLINKAVMQPSEFDMTDLRKDLEMEKRREEESKKRAEETKKAKEAVGERLKRIKKGLSVKGVEGKFFDPPPVKIKKVDSVKKVQKSAYETIKAGINGVLSESDEDDMLHESSVNPNDEYEIIPSIIKPTRYGRIPKARLPIEYNNDINLKEKKCEEKDLEPGSIMVVKTKTPSDDLVYKVYIVTNNQTRKQIDLAPNVVENLTTLNDNKLCGLETQNILTISTREYSDEECVNVLKGRDCNESETSNSSFKNIGTKELPIAGSSLSPNNIEILEETVVIPFGESLIPATPNKNITVSHEDNKMTVVTEN